MCVCVCVCVHVSVVQCMWGLVSSVSFEPFLMIVQLNCF